MSFPPQSKLLARTVALSFLGVFVLVGVSVARDGKSYVPEPVQVAVRATLEVIQANNANNIPPQNNNVPTNNTTNNVTNNVTNNAPPTNEPVNEPTNEPPGAVVPPGGVTPTPAPGNFFEQIAAFLESDIAQTIADVAGFVVAPLVGIGALVNLLFAAQIASWYPFLMRAIFAPFQLFAGRKKKWGIVYDSLAKLPVDLAIVRLYRVRDNRLLSTRVTDDTGRYSFLIEEKGLYRIHITHTDYRFPTVNLKGVKDDGEFKHLYHGDKIEIDEEESIDLNIPLDPLAREPTVGDALKRYWKKIWHNVAAYSGLVVGVVSFVIARTPLSLILLVVQILMFILYLRLAKGKKLRSWGTVYDRKSGQPLSHAVVRIFNQKYNRHLDTQVADRFGRYGFIVGKDAFYMDSIKQGFLFPVKRKRRAKDYLGGAIDVKQPGRIVRDIPMRPQKGGEQPVAAKPAANSGQRSGRIER